MASYGYLLPTRGAVLSSGDSQTLSAKAGADVIGLARRAEALGLDSVWAGDSVLAKPRFEALSTLAAVAGATDGVDLGTAVYLPTLRHAVNVAHVAATVDQLSGGRLRLGLGVGIGDDVEAEYDQLGLPFERRGDLMDETLEAVTGLWDGEASLDGEFYGLDDASIGFGPARKPPVYIASAAFDVSAGFPRRIRERAVEHGDGWLPTGFAPETYAAGLERLREILDEAGRDPDGLDPAYYMDVVIAEDEDAAISAAREFKDAYYPAQDPPSAEVLHRHGAFGPAEHVASRLEEYREAGVERFVIRFPASNQREQLGRLARLV